MKKVESHVNHVLLWFPGQVDQLTGGVCGAVWEGWAIWSVGGDLPTHHSYLRKETGLHCMHSQTLLVLCTASTLVQGCHSSSCSFLSIEYHVEASSTLWKTNCLFVAINTVVPAASHKYQSHLLEHPRTFSIYTGITPGWPMLVLVVFMYGLAWGFLCMILPIITCFFVHTLYFAVLNDHAMLMFNISFNPLAVSRGIQHVM